MDIDRLMTLLETYIFGIPAILYFSWKIFICGQFMYSNTSTMATIIEINKPDIRCQYFKKNKTPYTATYELGERINTLKVGNKITVHYADNATISFLDKSDVYSKLAGLIFLELCTLLALYGTTTDFIEHYKKSYHLTKPHEEKNNTPYF